MTLVPFSKGPKSTKNNNDKPLSSVCLSKTSSGFSCCVPEYSTDIIL